MGQRGAARRAARRCSPRREHFEQASTLVTRESTADSVTAGPDPADHVEALTEYVEAGFDEVYVANMGPHALEMIAFYASDVIPALAKG